MVVSFLAAYFSVLKVLLLVNLQWELEALPEFVVLAVVLGAYLYLGEHFNAAAFATMLLVVPVFCELTLLTLFHKN